MVTKSEVLPSSSLQSPPWYVVHTKPRQEWLAAGLLEAHYHAVTFLPEVIQPRRGQTPRLPLFPSYLFVQVDLEQTPVSMLNAAPGVIRLVSFGGQPQALSAALVELLRGRVAELNRQGGLPRHGFQPGAAVRLVEGPLQGLEAVFVGPLRPAARVRVLLEFLGSQKTVEVPVEHLEPVKAEHPPRRTRGKGRPIQHKKRQESLDTDSHGGHGKI